MCDILTAVVGLLGTAFSAAGQYAQAQQQQEAAESQARYNAAIAADQAKVSQALAQNELAKGEADRERVLRAGAQEMGEQRSQLAASGFTLSGSNASLLADQATEIQYDANIVTNNAAMAAWQHQADANSAENEVAWQGYKEDQADSGSLALGLSIGGTVLGGIGKMVSHA